LSTWRVIRAKTFILHTPSESVGNLRVILGSLVVL
jgi:hypothetical protein